MGARVVTRQCVIALFGVLLWLVFAGSAQAAFPGTNGRIAFNIGDHIWTMNPDGTDKQQMTTGTGFLDFGPAWSPDATQIAFSRDFFADDCCGGFIQVADGDGSDERSVAQGDGPSFSPTGSRFAFVDPPVCTDSDCTNAALAVMDAGGSNRMQLTSPNGGLDVFDASWSPTSDTIAFSIAGPGGGRDIYKIQADGTGLLQLTSGTKDDAAPSWSPDGTRLAFERDVGSTGGAVCSFPSAGCEIYVMDANGANQTRITTNTNPDRFPAWSPDGSRIAFERQSNCNPSCARSDVYTMRPDGTDEVNLTSDLGGAGAGGDVDWQRVISGYTRPKGATPILVSLVPAYAPCTSPNRIHYGLFEGTSGSCSPPTQASAHLTTGTPDAGGGATNMTASARFDVCPVPGCAAPNVNVMVNVNDVRCQSPPTTSCGPANAGGGPDYAGELRAALPLRITDSYNGPSLNEAGTVSDTSFGVTIPCTATAGDTAKGSTCTVATTANAVVSGSAVAGQKAIWEIEDVSVDDGGADGDGDTTGDNQPFLRQGMFWP